jgi:hypothetical protein
MKAGARGMRLRRKADVQRKIWSPLFFFASDLVHTLEAPRMTVLHGAIDDRVQAAVDACLYIANKPRIAVTFHTHAEYLRLAQTLQHMTNKEWLGWTAPLAVVSGAQGLIYQVAFVFSTATIPFHALLLHVSCHHLPI